jgi:Uma2 family endonuclease
MTLPLSVRDAEGQEYWGPYILYLSDWTEERYFAEAPEMWITEFVDGEMIVHSPASVRHQQVTAFLIKLLGVYVDSKELGTVLQGPAVARLRPDLNYEPDIFYVPTERLHQLEEQRFSGAPNLVVEVLSDSTRSYDLGVKASNYRRNEVPEYWAVDTANRVLLRHLLPSEPQAPYLVSQLSSGRLDSQEIPGFWIDVSWLWAEPLPSSFVCLKELVDL